MESTQTAIVTASNPPFSYPTSGISVESARPQRFIPIHL